MLCQPVLSSIPVRTLVYARLSKLGGSERCEQLVFSCMLAHTFIYACSCSPLCSQRNFETYFCPCARPCNHVSVRIILRARLPDMFEADYEWSQKGKIRLEPPVERVVIRVDPAIAPLAAENFITLCDGACHEDQSISLSG